MNKNINEIIITNCEHSFSFIQLITNIWIELLFQFALQLFLKLRNEQPKFRHQIVALAGDCSQPNLGMSAQDRATIIREVSIVFHVAATVRFDEKLKLAVPINVRSTRDMLNLCKEITNLKVRLDVLPKQCIVVRCERVSSSQTVNECLRLISINRYGTQKSKTIIIS